MSKFDVTYEKSEPTLQREIIEPHQQSEMKIQQNMDEMFHQERESVENGGQKSLKTKNMLNTCFTSI